jgi:pimeloyl-ACP methyl ester carboxylesterase
MKAGDGRRLGYAQYGRPDGEPLFYFHGHPGSRQEARRSAGQRRHADRVGAG